MKKRILSTMMALALCLSLLPTAAFAEGEDNTGADVPMCTCETACTADAMNANCPVCGAEGVAVQNCGRYAAHTAEEPDTSPAPAGPDNASAPAEPATEPAADTDPVPETNPIPETAPAPETDPEPDAAVTAAQALIDALPTAETVTADDYGTVQAAYDAYEALTDEQQAQITGADCFRSLFAWFNAQTATLDESTAHTHYLCGGTTCTGTGSHTCESAVTFEKWSETDSLPTTKGNYYLDADVTLSECWEPASGTILCLNGHTVTMNLSDAAICNEGAFILTDCNASDKQGRITHGKDTSGDTYSGWGIFNVGTFTMFGGIISGNRDDYGAGVYNTYYSDSEHTSFGTFTMYGGTISGNTATEGGGGVLNQAAFYLYGGTISNNSTLTYGGGVESGDSEAGHLVTFNMTGGTISDNTATEGGGGVAITTVTGSRSVFTMSGGTISDNTARMSSDHYTQDYGYGGGVYIVKGEFNLSATSSITENTSGQYGGGVYLYEGKFNMTGGSITKNTASGKYNSTGTRGSGGGVYSASSEFNMSAGSIANNVAGDKNDASSDGYSGGVYLGNSRFSMTGGSITGNTAYGYNRATGGGIGSWYSSISMTGGSITGNTTYDRGGGIYADSTTITVGGSAKITGNQEDYYSTKTDDNLYLYNSQVALDADTPLTTGAAFGVSCAAGRTVVTGIGGNAAYFTADSNPNELVVQGSDLVMQTRVMDLIVNGVYVSGSNDDVLGDGGSIKYDQTTHTLTLTNANITKACENVSGHVAVICAFNYDNTLNIVLVGDNTITVPSTPTKYLSAGIDAYDVKISGSGSLTVTGASAREYTCGLDTRCLTIDDGVTLYAAIGNTATTDYFAWNGAIYASQSLTIGKATVTGIAGAASSGKNWAYSYGIYAEDLTIKDGAVVSGTGSTATSGKNGSNGTGGSYGIYVNANASIGSAKVTAVSGTCSAETYGYASGLSVTGNLTISNGAEITATGGNVSASGSSTPSSTDGYARGRGIYVGKDLTVGKAKITATSGTLSGRTGGYSSGIYVHNNAVIGNGAEVTATSGSITSTGINSEVYGSALCLALVANGSLTLGKATVKAVAGDALVLNTGILMDTSSEYPYNYYSSYARSYAVYVGKVLETAAGSKVTAIAGTATCLDPNDSTKSGQYLNAYSYGVFLVDGGTLSGTMIATGGNACGHYGTYVYEDDAGPSVTKTPGGYAGSFGIAVDDGDLTIKRGANVKATSAHAETNGTEVGYVYSEGLYVYGGDLTMEGGALSVSAGTVKNGEGNDSTGLIIGTNETDDNTPVGGQLIVRGGWLKAEADDRAIMTEEGITLTNVQISTPTGGKIGTTEIDDYTYSAILNTSGEVATAALIWDGTTAAFTDGSSSGNSPSSGSSSSGSSGITSTTVKNPDGSTTTTTTNKKTGVVTETTKQSDGTTATTVTDKNGNVTDISATIPASAAKNGKVVTLPIDAVKPTDSRNAQEINVDVPSGGATVEIPVKNPTSGTVVVIVGKDGTETVVPGVNVTENGVTVTLTSDATIKVIDNSRTFTDVPAGAYFADAVQWAAANGITGGTTDTTFSPYQPCTRAQIVTFLWRAAGQPTVDYAMDFADVDEGAYYCEAVRWAASLGIVGGYGNGLFGTGDTVTRQQVAAILYRFAVAQGMDVSAGEDTNILSYNDAFSVTEYAVSAFQWATGAGIVQGSDGYLLPNSNCTRAQIVTFLYRLLGK